MKRHRRSFGNERGQVVVFFALLIPVIFALGSIVMSAGNWYVLKRHLQTQVDAAALAGGAVANGCEGDSMNQALTRDKMKAEALKYSGDTSRTGTYNYQPEDVSDVRIVLNSTRYWDSGDPTDGSGLDWTLGEPCTTKFLDVKATDYHVPALVSWIPLFPSVKAKARVELRETENTNGVRPIGVPEFDPVKVAALFVDEGVNNANNPNSVSGRGFITHIDPSTLPRGPVPPASPLLGLNAWQGTVAGVNLNNTSNHSVIILASRDPNVNLNYGNGSVQQVCNQDPVQTNCYGGPGLNDGISLIHIYSGSGPTPAIRDATLSGGCATADSRPYYNLDAQDSNGIGCTLTVSAQIDFGTGGTDPTDPPDCATASIVGGTAMGYDSGSDRWIGTKSFPSSPSTPAGRYYMDIDWTTRKTGSGPCATGTTKTNSGTLQDVAGAYVADDKSDAIEYLKLDNMTAGLPTTDGNSYPKTPNASVQVTVGFVPPLRDTPITDPPIKLRFGTGPSQTQALDCGSGAGPNGWRGKMVTGCDAYQVNNRNGSCATPYPTPPDCIDSENGNFNNKGIQDAFASPCTPNYWDGVTYPPDSDPRWIPLFILDQNAFTSPGKKTYPIRRFGGFYVTAGDGMGCPGDDPASGVKRTEVWGHFVTYFRPGFGDTIPSSQLCTYTDANLCVLSLVE